MLKADADGRYPMSLREYETMRYLYGVIDALARENFLEERLKLVPGGWRDFKMMQAKAKTLFDRLLTTIPFKKLLSMRAELTHTECHVSLNRAAKENGLSLVETEKLWKLVEKCAGMDCVFCEKSAAEGRKCEIFNVCMDCLNYEFKGIKGACPFAGSGELRRDDEFDIPSAAKEHSEGYDFSEVKAI